MTLIGRYAPLDGLEFAEGFTFTETQIVVENNGGRVLTTTVSGVPDGRYRVHVGPAGDATDPLLYSGVSGEGSTVVVTGGAFTGVVPVLPVGGPYPLFFADLDSSSTYPVLDKVVVIPHQGRSRVYSLNQILPPRWVLGPRRLEAERYPQA